MTQFSLEDLMSCKDIPVHNRVGYASLLHMDACNEDDCGILRFTIRDLARIECVGDGVWDVIHGLRLLTKKQLISFLKAADHYFPPCNSPMSEWWQYWDETSWEWGDKEIAVFVGMFKD